MRNYFKDKNTLSIPWVESPFFYSLLENSDHTEEVKEMCKYYHENGYLIIDLDLTDEEIQPIVNDMYKSLEDDNTVFHAEHYQYTESKRIFETLKPKFKYSYSKNQIRKFSKKKNFRLIGMGGSVLGAKAIYHFLNHKIKKKFVFINNLNSNLSKNEKKIKATNIIISKSGNTLETIVNSNVIINNSKNIFITENKDSYLKNLAIDLKLTNILVVFLVPNV